MMASRSHPARGGWIEIQVSSVGSYSISSHPARGGWIEIKAVGIRDARHLSHPARGGWIEIDIGGRTTHGATVPPRTGWVD